jgi:hypothetical protein
VFPKNDFDAFHRSGYDEHGIFRPELADRSLLFNADHPDPDDPLHLFGVDDGEGYVDAEGHRWRFIGAYLIYGQWKRLIVNGIVNLSSAYSVTGDERYAYKAALMLDRVADAFPEFDFGEQGIVYERKGDRGQISTWHDACEEVRMLALAYDRIFDGARSQEQALTAFLSKKAEEHKLANPKRSWSEIQQNIEDRILRDTIANSARIQTNYPRREVALMVIKTVLDWPSSRDEVLTMLDETIARATAVDGVSGEKGLYGYSTIAPRAVGEILGRFSLLEPDFLKTVCERHPILHQTYRFHIDTWCMDEWYPRSGDTGAFGTKATSYCGLSFSKNPGVSPSMWTLLSDLHRLTSDPAFAQILYKMNGNSVERLPYDLFVEDPAAMQAGVQRAIDDVGPDIGRDSVNKQEWCIAILRSGEGEHRRALWLDYDARGAHGHADGMNLGLFAKGLDLIPDFGYPPVGFGGWGSPVARWYTMTAAHATVVVDGRNHDHASGKTTLWADGNRFRAVRAAAPEMYGIERYERLAAMRDLDDTDFYVVDCFFVTGGADHAKFFHSFFGAVQPAGLTLSDAPDYGYDTQMRNFRIDAAPAQGWSVDWALDDPYDYLAEGKDVHLRYTDLTADAQAGLAEGWINPQTYGEAPPEWIPRTFVRRHTEELPLTSAFVSVIEPYEGRSNLRGIRRLPLETMNARALPDTFVGVEVVRTDGRVDVWLAVEGRGPVEMIEPDHDIHLRGELAAVTFSAQGVEQIVVGKSDWIRVGKLAVMLEPGTEFIELVRDGDAIRVTAGPRDRIEYVTWDDIEIPVE